MALQCAPSRAWRLACAAIGAAAMAAACAWAAGHSEWALPASLALCSAAGICGASLGLRIAGPRRRAEVRWDGQDWHVDGSIGGLQVMLDLDRWLLLLRHQAKDGAGVRWVAFSFDRGADEHRALRSALYSPPPEPTSDPPHVRVPDRAID